MSLDGAYDHDNVFAKILRGDLPAAVVADDAQTLTIMDAFPQSRGHTLVLPKAPCRNLLDCPPEALASVARQTQRVGRAIRLALNPEGVLISQFNGSVAGQTVFHLHVHLIPRWQARPLARHGEAMADIGALRSLAAQIAAALE